MVPDALKPAICPRCDGGRYYDGDTEWCGCYTSVDSRSDTGPPCDRHACRTCGGSGINPDMILDSALTSAFVGPFVSVRDSGRYVVIPLGGIPDA